MRMVTVMAILRCMRGMFRVVSCPALGVGNHHVPVAQAVEGMLRGVQDYAEWMKTNPESSVVEFNVIVASDEVYTQFFS